VVLGSLLLALGARAQLVTINESFAGTTLSGWTVAGTNFTPVLTAAQGIDPNGSGWLRLTSAGNNQATYAAYDTPFASANATIAVSFAFATYGGNGADGITFFLADGSKPFAPGAYGGSLGYAQRSGFDGLNGGYIGVGIDEFGNFSNPTEGRVGGTGFLPNAIAVRGPGQGQTGYEFLGGTGTLATPLSFAGATRPTGVNYREMQMVITATNQLSVYLKSGTTGSYDLLYSLDFSGYTRPDTLRLGFTGSTGGSTNIHEVKGLSLTSVVANLWTNFGGTSTWGSAGNWDGTQLPVANADILLDNTYVSSAQTIAVGQNRVIRNLQLDAPFGYTLNGGSLEFNSGGRAGPSGIFVTQTKGSAAHTINSPITLGNAIEIKNDSSGALAVNGTIATNGNTIALGGSGNTTLGGVVSGAGALTKGGAGNVTLAAANTYTGGTTLNAGTLTANHNSALGTGAVVLNGGTLASTTGRTVGNVLTLQGNAGLDGITTTGALTQTNGSYTLNLANATQAGTVNLSNNNTGRTLTVAVDSGVSTISGVIQNGGTSAGGLTKTGAGTLVVSGNNTYTGTTTIDTGTLRLGASNRLADTGAVVIGGSGTLDLNGFSERIGNLTASAGGATVNFGATPGANDLLFNTFTAPPSGVMVVNNWESGLDRLATTVNNQGSVSSIYFSGFGVAGYTGSTATMFGATGRLLAPVAAVAKEWNGSVSTQWSTNNNWTTSGEPGTTEIAFFNTLGVARPDAIMTANDTMAGIRFGPLAPITYNVAGNTANRTLTLAGAVPYIQQQSAVNQNISVGRLQLNAATVADITGAGNLTISSSLYGNTNLIKDGTGAGKLILSGSNTNLTGSVFVNNGVVQAANTNALGLGATTVANGAGLELSGGISPTNAVTVGGTGVGGAGAIRSVAGTNTLSGTITQTAATSLTADAGATLNLSGNVTGTNTATTFGGAGDINVARLTTGSADVTVAGTGTVTFNGGTNANTYTGTTFVNSGTLVLAKTAGTNAIAGNVVVGDGTGTDTLRLAASNQIADSATVTINNGGVFNLNGQSETVSGLAATSSGAAVQLGAGTLTIGGTGSSSFAGAISGTGTLVKSGAGQLALSGASSYSGGTSLQNGIITAGSNTALGTGTVTIASGGNLELQNNITLANNFSLNSSGTFAGDGAIEAVAGNNTLTGTVTLTGSSLLQAGTGSTLNVNGGVALGANTMTLGGAGNFQFGGVVSGTGGLTKTGTGTVTMTGSSTYTGPTNITGGTLTLAANERLSNSTAVTVGAGATFDLNNKVETIGSIAGNGSILIGTGQLIAGGTNANTSFGGTITGSGAGNLTKTGTGTLTITSNLGYNGGLSVAGGTLQFNTNNTLGGELTLGAGTTLRLTDASLNVSSLRITGNTTIDFAGATSLLNVTNLTIDPGVTVTVANWQNAADFFFAQNFAGAVQNVRGLAPLDQIVFTPNPGSSTIWLPYNNQITPVPEPSTYGALLLGAGLAVFGWRRWRQRRVAA